MTTDEKLRTFYESSLENARAQALSMIQDKEAAIDKLLLEHKQTKDQAIAEELETETKAIDRENNRIISAKMLEIKRQYSLLREKLIEDLFQQVEDKVLAFKKTDAYTDFLQEQIRYAVDFAGEDEIFLFADASDKDLLPRLQERTGARIQISDVALLGGIRAEIPSKNILIDNSFAKKIADLRKEYSFGPDVDGGFTL